MKTSLGIVHGDKIDAWFFHTILGLLTSSHDKFPLKDHVAVRSGPLLSQGRGKLAGAFLTQTTSDALLMLDSDQYATPEVIYSHIDAFERIRADHPDVGILAGVTYIATDPAKADVLYPNIWMPGHHPGQMLQMGVYPKDTCMEIAAAGCSNMIVHRDVLQQFADENINPFHHLSIVDYGILAQGITAADPAQRPQILKSVIEDADQWGEDLSFCRRVRDRGWKIMCHTGIQYEHAKSILLDEQMYDAAVARHSSPVEEPTTSQEPVNA